ncbi:MAG: HD domain-containing protein [Lachnospiraceae bacterium]
MKRYQRIQEHPLFRETMGALEQLEKDRIFCCHNIEHLIAVARISYILALEEALLVSDVLEYTVREPEYSRDIYYAAALLHDIGKVEQYEQGIPHEVAAKEKVALILWDCGYDEKEIVFITDLVASHRTETQAQKSPYHYALYRADKLSRECFACKANQECNWKEDRKNMRLEL